MSDIEATETSPTNEELSAIRAADVERIRHDEAELRWSEAQQRADEAQAKADVLKADIDPVVSDPAATPTAQPEPPVPVDPAATPGVIDTGQGPVLVADGSSTPQPDGTTEAAPAPADAPAPEVAPEPPADAQPAEPAQEG